MNKVSGRRIAVLDQEGQDGRMLEQRLGPVYQYEWFHTGHEALTGLDGQNPAMVFVSDSVSDMDLCEWMIQMRLAGFDGIDAVLYMHAFSEEKMNRAYRSGYDLVLSAGMDEKAFLNVLEWKLMTSGQKRSPQEEGLRRAHEKSLEVMLSVLYEGMAQRSGPVRGAAMRHRAFMREMLVSLQKKAGWYHMADGDIDQTVMASMVYDVGMLEVPDEILQKKGKLTEAEWEIIKAHPRRGADLVSRCCADISLPIAELAGVMCLYHHERADGSGYPEGLKDHEIPLSAAVCGIVECYIALRSDRAWRPAYDEQTALDMIASGKCGMFDPVLVEVLKETAVKLESHNFDLDYENHELTEQVKNQFFQDYCPGLEPANEEPVSRLRMIAELSHDIIFAFTREPPVLNLSEHAADKFGLPDQIENPVMDGRVRAILEKEDMEKLWHHLETLEDHHDRVREDVRINYRGHKEWNRIIAAPVYQNGVLTGCAGVMNNVNHEHEMLDSLAFQAVHDPLTGLYNRNYFRQKASELLKNYLYPQYAFCEIDVDHFKQINDAYGHSVGDAVLIRLSRLMMECTRMEDLAVRLGGDEFLLFYAFDSNFEAPVKRLFAALESEQGKDGIPPFTISCGITTTILSGREYEKLYHDADQALYEAKQKRGSYGIFQKEELK
jgi:putative two-component system response regulator